MYKKIFINFILIAFLNFIAGCSSFHTVSISEYEQIEEEEGKPDEIFLTTNDNKRYHLMRTDYFIENDTLYGKGKLLVDREELINKKIALSDIAVIETEKINWGTTSCLGIGIFTALVGTILIIYGFSQVLSN